MKVIFVDTVDELKELELNIENEKESYWFIQWVDSNKHPLNSQISFISVYLQNSIYLIGLDHIDLSPFKYGDIERLLQINSKKYFFRLKETIHLFPIAAGIDVDTYWFLKKGDKIDYDTLFYSLYNTYHRNGIYDEVNKSIPIVKWVECIEKLFKDYEIKDNHLIQGTEWYSHTYIPTLRYIENNGLWVDRQFFLKRYPNAKHQITNNDKVYTQYNPYTTTGRPSNTHSGVNYLALPKEDGTRSIFHSNNGTFYQLDYDAHHLRLIGHIVGEGIPTTVEGHQWMADQYGCDIKTSKSITWRLLYGGIDDEFLVLPFYKKTQTYIDALWEESTKKGYIQTKYKQIPLKWMVDITPQKIFNYQLQALELEKNIDILSSFIPTINQKNLYILLYTYDSYLLWIDRSTNEDVIMKSKTYLENGKFPIKIKKGKTLDDL